MTALVGPRHRVTLFDDLPGAYAFVSLNANGIVMLTWSGHRNCSNSEVKWCEHNSPHWVLSRVVSFCTAFGDARPGQWCDGDVLSHAAKVSFSQWRRNESSRFLKKHHTYIDSTGQNWHQPNCSAYLTLNNIVQHDWSSLLWFRLGWDSDIRYKVVNVARPEKHTR